MTIDFAANVNNLMGSVGFLYIVKILLLIVEALYGIFAFIVVRQVSLMNKTLQTEMGSFFTLLAYVHFFAVLAVFVLSLVIL